MEMKRNTIYPFSDLSAYDSSSSSEELQPPGKKFCMKMKIPLKPTKTTQENNTNPPPPRRHFCEVCNKEFTSGKALGGHVRIHSIDNKSNKKTKNNMWTTKRKKKIGKEERDALVKADVNENGEIECCLCGKVFQTKHSLFGHMRRHPERSWKGIRPPPPSENEFGCRMMLVTGSSSSSEKHKINSCSSDLDDEWDFGCDDGVMSSSASEIHEAACCLMMLSCSRSNWRPVSSGFGEDSSSGHMKKSKSEVRKENVLVNGPKDGDDQNMMDKGLIVDMKIKMEIEVTMNPGRDDLQDRSHEKMFGFDLNRPFDGEDGEIVSDLN